MSVELKVPSVGESITEVVIGEWLKAEGDWVQEDEIIVIVESDKVNLEVPAPIEGQITKVLMASGDTVGIGALMAEITPGKAPAAAHAPTASTPEAGTNSQTSPQGAIMPAAQRLLALNQLSASDVKATGPGGRLLKEDVERHLSSVKAAPAKAEAAKAVPSMMPPAPSSGERSEKRTRMTPLRKTVAKRLVEAQQSAASVLRWVAVRDLLCP
jgi:2-oxoglutarate dehydrogenase E2 component (dihydrolipoamide succinyltransferase)